MTGWKKVSLALFCVVIVGVVYLYETERSGISAFYRVIEQQERIKSDVPVTDRELQVLQTCSTGYRADECMRSFYDDYATEHGVEDAFAHLARLQIEHPDLLRNCHYISHGIGHAALRLDENDPSKAFSVLRDGALFKNISTCGNGYFHGVIEEFAKDIGDEDTLVAVLRPVCEAIDAAGSGDCYHGVGHAALIQTKYDVPAMLRVCDKISDDPHNVFFCDTGGFMEYQSERSGAVTFDGTSLNFALCDSVEPRRQAACYLEMSGKFEDFYTGKKNDYTFLMGLCKQIPDEVNRMACVKLFAIRAVRVAHYEDIPQMCRNTSTIEERVMCTAVVARKIAFSIERDPQSGIYREVVGSLCDPLQAPYSGYCRDLVLKQDVRLFYTSEADLRFSPVP